VWWRGVVRGVVCACKPDGAESLLCCMTLLFYLHTGPIISTYQTAP
jgi:hypothetical protein